MSVKQNVVESAYWNLAQIHDYPAAVWYTLKFGWDCGPVLSILTPHEACQLGFEDQVLKAFRDWRIAYEQLEARL